MKKDFKGISIMSALTLALKDTIKVMNDKQLLDLYEKIKKEIKNRKL